MPSSHAVELGDVAAIEEERRLFYVALTRAKDRVVVTVCAERLGSATAEASRFLGEGVIGRRLAAAKFERVAWGLTPAGLHAPTGGGGGPIECPSRR